MRVFLRNLGSGVRDLGLSRTSAALSFTTLVALVPLASVAVATVARFPIFDLWVGALEKFLLDNQAVLVRQQPALSAT